MKTLVYYLLVCTLLFSCKKPENRSCFKSIGTIVSKEIYLNEFDKLILNEHLTYTIIQDSANKVVLTGGKNLLNHVELNLNENQLLEIKNKNKCNFLRNYKKKINVEIHLKSLVNIEFIGTDSLKNLGELHVDYFTLVVKDGAGSVKLNVNAKYVNAIVTGGFGDFTLTGKSDAAKLIVNGNGYCNTKDLQIKDSLIVISNSAAPIWINASNTLFKCQIKNNGDIFYKGSPSKIEFINLGKGNLIQKN